MGATRIIYSISVEDVQNAAEEYLGRQVSKKEMKIIEDKLGDYIDWHEAIVLAIDDAVHSKEKLKPDRPCEG